MNLENLLKAQLEALSQKKNICVVTLLESAGQTPRSCGKMIVYEDGAVLGTVGGGAREKAAADDAAACIRTGRTMEKSYDFESAASDNGEECGGRIRLLFETYVSRPQLVMIGAGHVGRNVLKIAEIAGFATTLIDDRDVSEIADAVSAADAFIPVPDFGEAVKALDLPEDAFYVVASHSHAGDADALQAVLGKKAAYVGMIGSTRKKASTWEKLMNRGITKEQLDAVHCPVGLDLGGETPEEIAVGIVAEILAVKYGKDTATFIK